MFDYPQPCFSSLQTPVSWHDAAAGRAGAHQRSASWGSADHRREVTRPAWEGMRPGRELLRARGGGGRDPGWGWGASAGPVAAARVTDRQAEAAAPADEAEWQKRQREGEELPAAGRPRCPYVAPGACTSLLSVCPRGGGRAPLGPRSQPLPHVPVRSDFTRLQQPLQGLG